MLYGNNDTLSFEDVKSNLLSKKKFDLEVHCEEKGESLSVRGRTLEKREYQFQKVQQVQRQRIQK
jgi:hypothetical protein